MAAAPSRARLGPEFRRRRGIPDARWAVRPRGGAIESPRGRPGTESPGFGTSRSRFRRLATTRSTLRICAAGRTATLEALEQEIKELIIDVLMLEDVAPADIEPKAALFVEGLGLDSIDALELAMALEERYGVKIGDDPDQNQQIFASVRDLAAFVTENRV
jgi:acyl carrier protein